jgi:WD40 repeat protein
LLAASASVQSGGGSALPVDVHIWDVSNDVTLLQAVHARHREVRVVAFGRCLDREILAVGGVDSVIELRDPLTQASVGAHLKGHRGTVRSLAFGPGSLLASGATDGTIRLWHLPTGQQIGEPLRSLDSGHAHGPQNLSFGHVAGRHVLAAAGIGGPVQVWELEVSARTDPSVGTQTPTPNIDARLILNLVDSGDGWAAVSAGGRSFKSDGDVSRQLWWAIKTSRFEVGELDRFDSVIRRMPDDESFFSESEHP